MQEIIWHNGEFQAAPKYTPQGVLQVLLQEVPQCQQHGQTHKGSPQGQQVTTVPLQAGKLHRVVWDTDRELQTPQKRA